MTIKECYEKIGGDYEDVLERMMREGLVEKFMLKFLDDPSYGNLCRAVEEKNQPDAFRAAHTIKGICQNLSFTKLFESANLLTQELRNGCWGDNTEKFLLMLQIDYSNTVKAIEEYKSQM